MVGGRQRRPKRRAVASKHQKERRKRKNRERGGGGLVGWGRWLGWVEVLVEKKEKCELLLRRSQVAMTHEVYHSVALHAREMVKKFWQPKWIKISLFLV